MINKKQTSTHAALKNLLIFPVAAMIFAAFSCTNSAINPKDSPKELTGNTIDNRSQNGEEVFAKVDQMPEFPGGNTAMMEFINKELKYPDAAKAKAIDGTVIVTMTIDKEGKVKDAKVMRGNSILGAEALRVLNSMPAWTPGKQGGRPVAVAFTMPFKFKLN